MGFFGFFNCYTLRVNLSVAMVAMVNVTYLRELEVADATDSNFTDSGSTCGGVDDGDNTTKLSNMTEQVFLSAVTSDFHKLFNLFFFCWVKTILFLPRDARSASAVLLL